MLAMIGKTQEEKIQYALDGKFYLLNIYKLSFEALKEQEVNSEKYSSLNGKTVVEQQNVLKSIACSAVSMPESVK